MTAMAHDYRDDLKEVRDEIIEEMREGFKGVFQRQDQTNGRVRAGEILSAEHSIRLKNIEREVFRDRDRDPFDRRRHDDSGTRLPAVPLETGPTKITERDVKIVLWTLGSASGVIGFFWKALPAILRAVGP